MAISDVAVQVPKPVKVSHSSLYSFLHLSSWTKAILQRSSSVSYGEVGWGSILAKLCRLFPKQIQPTSFEFNTVAKPEQIRKTERPAIQRRNRRFHSGEPLAGLHHKLPHNIMEPKHVAGFWEKPEQFHYQPIHLDIYSQAGQSDLRGRPCGYSFFPIPILTALSSSIVISNQPCSSPAKTYPGALMSSTTDL